VKINRRELLQISQTISRAPIMASDNPHNFPPTLTPSQWITLYSLTSAIIQPFTEDEITAYIQSAATDISKEHVRSFLLEEANYTNPRFRFALEHTLEKKLPKSSVQAICFVLGLLEYAPLPRAQFTLHSLPQPEADDLSTVPYPAASSSPFP